MPPDQQDDEEPEKRELVESEPIDIPPSPFEELLPEDTPIQIRRVVRTMSLMMMVGPMRGGGDPLLDKLDKGQIDK